MKMYQAVIITCSNQNCDMIVAANEARTSPVTCHSDACMMRIVIPDHEESKRLCLNEVG